MKRRDYTRSMEGVTFVGDSHMACVLVAAEKAGISLNTVVLKASVAREFVRAGGDADSQPKTGARLSKSSAAELAGTVCSFIGGRHLAALTLYGHPRPFDFVLAESPDLPIERDAELIPVTAMKAVLEKGANRDLRRIQKVASDPETRVFQFEAPPPVWTLKGSGPPYLRYKISRLYAQIVQELCERLGAKFVPSPREALDERGFLRGEFLQQSNHANAAYGALVLEQIASLQ